MPAITNKQKIVVQYY